MQFLAQLRGRRMIAYGQAYIGFFQFPPTELSKLCLWGQLRWSWYILGALRRVFSFEKYVKIRFFVDFVGTYAHQYVIICPPYF